MTKRKVTDLLPSEAKSKLFDEDGLHIYPATDFIPTEAEKVEVDDYWKTRCELSEAIIEACPCDPDITNEQIEAWKNYHEFIKTRNPETK